MPHGRDMIDWRTEDYHPVVYLPDEYEVRDFTNGEYSPSEYEFDIGRYDAVSYTHLTLPTILLV